MGSTEAPEFRQVTEPGQLAARERRELVACWVAVTNSGGAAGFPFPPVSAGQVDPVAGELIGGLAPGRSRLLLATAGGALAGWVSLQRSVNPVIAHWGTIRHLQTHPGFRGRGLGAALMGLARRVARDEMVLEQLRLAARGGTGLESYYQRLGWREIGRWPGALRLAPGDDRDEILMVLTPL